MDEEAAVLKSFGARALAPSTRAIGWFALLEEFLNVKSVLNPLSPNVEEVPMSKMPRKKFLGRYVGSLSRGEAPHGSRCRRRYDVQEGVQRMKRGGGLHPARPDWWLPKSF